jgi:hypothetical protein
MEPRGSFFVKKIRAGLVAFITATLCCAQSPNDPTLGTTTDWVKEKINAESGTTIYLWKQGGGEKTTVRVLLTTSTDPCTWTFTDSRVIEAPEGRSTISTIQVLHLWDVAGVSSAFDSSPRILIRAAPKAVQTIWRKIDSDGIEKSDSYVTGSVIVYIDRSDDPTVSANLIPRLEKAISHAAALCANRNPQSKEPF